MFGRKIRTRLDVIKEIDQEQPPTLQTQLEAQEKQQRGHGEVKKQLMVEELVSLEDYRTPNTRSWTEAKISKVPNR